MSLVSLHFSAVKFRRKHLIEFDVKDDATYEQYIHAIDAIWTQIDQLRYDYALEHLGLPADSLDAWNHRKEKKAVIKALPKRLLQMTIEEKRQRAAWLAQKNASN